VLDFDGLVLDTETPLYVSWNEIYREADLEVQPEEWASILGTAADPPAAYEFLERHLGLPIDREAVRARRAAREAELLTCERPLPGVRTLLRDAKAVGISAAIASSSERSWVEGHLARFALSEFFDVLVCAEDVEHTKPAPDLYLTALRRLRVGAREAMAFEDSPRGVEAAKSAGLFCVAVPNAVTRSADFARADIVIPSLASRSLARLIRDAESTVREASD
jgi:HAD superfamily hydrolase (TIGR01509 family)